jgi:hypothetical protein
MQNVVKIGQNYRILHMKTWVRFITAEGIRYL